MLLLCMSSIYNLCAQSHRTYTGLYNGGKATYTYVEDTDGSRIMDGKFVFEKYGFMNGSAGEVYGSYKMGNKNGLWIYKRRGSPIGILKVNYVNGNMNGIFSYRCGNEFYQINFLNNRIIGSIQVPDDDEFPHGTIQGQFDDEGYPTGKWIYKYEDFNNPYIVTEIYNSGNLKSKSVKNEATGDIKEISLEDIEKTYDGRKELAPYKVERLIYDWLRWFACEEVIGGMLYKGIGKIEIEVAPPAPDEGIVFSSVAVMPEFPGGKNKMNAYIYENIHYPSDAKEEGKSGKVIVECVINHDGSISDVAVIRHLSESLDKEAIRIVQSMPKWSPGRQGDKTCRVKIAIPINFKLENNE